MKIQTDAGARTWENIKADKISAFGEGTAHTHTQSQVWSGHRNVHGKIKSQRPIHTDINDGNR
jgi:N-acetylmuramoyl-L-alanine amidase CwlA